MAPSHSSREKPPNNSWQNLTHSGIVLGGLSWLRPSRSSTSRARCTVRPYNVSPPSPLALSTVLVSLYILFYTQFRVMQVPESWKFSKKPEFFLFGCVITKYLSVFSFILFYQFLVKTPCTSAVL